MTRTPRLSRWQLGSEASAAVNGGNGSSVKRPGGPGWKNGLLILVALDLARRRICLKVDFGNSERIRNVQTCPNSCYCCDRKNTFRECARSITCFCTVDLDCFQIKYLQGKESWRCLRTKTRGTRAPCVTNFINITLVTDRSTCNIKQPLQVIAYNSIK